MATTWLHEPGRKNQKEMESAIRGLGYILEDDVEFISKIIKKYRDKLEYMKENNIKSIPFKELGISEEEQDKVEKLIDQGKWRVRPTKRDG